MTGNSNRHNLCVTPLVSDMTPEQLQVLKKQLEGEVTSLQAKLAWLKDQLNGHL